MDRARLAPVTLPDFGMPTAMPSMPPATHAARLEALRERAERRGYQHIVVYADREHSANMSFLTGFDPRFEEAILRRRPRRQHRPSWSATSASPWPVPRRCRCAASCSRTSACRPAP